MHIISLDNSYPYIPNRAISARQLEKLLNNPGRIKPKDPLTGLTYTPLFPRLSIEELAFVRHRRDHGPFREAGDLVYEGNKIARSPGGYSRMESVANRFKKAFTENNGKLPDKYAYRPGVDYPDSEVPKIFNKVHNVGFNDFAAEELSDAALYALINNDIPLKHQLKIVVQSALNDPLWQFSGTPLAEKRWPDGVSVDGDFWAMSAWRIALKDAFRCAAYTERGATPVLTKKEINQYLAFFDQITQKVCLKANKAIDDRLPNRLNGFNEENYTGIPSWLGTESKIRFYGDTTPCNNLHRLYNNRRAFMFMEVMDWGCYRNNKLWITDARRFYMESIMFNIFSDQIPAEFERWTEKSPHLGFHYHCTLYASLIWIAEMSKRYGDGGALYNFTTSFGLQGSGGGPKNLLMSMEKICDMMLDNISCYGTDKAENTGAPAYLCRLRTDADHWNTYLVANNHFKSKKIRNALMRIGTIPDSHFRSDMKGDADREHQKQPFGAGWSTYFMYALRDGKNDAQKNPLCYPVL